MNDKDMSPAGGEKYEPATASEIQDQAKAAMAGAATQALIDHLGLKVVVDKGQVRVERPKGNVLSSQAQHIATLGERVRVLEASASRKESSTQALADALGYEFFVRPDGSVLANPDWTGKSVDSRVKGLEQRIAELEADKAAEEAHQHANEPVGLGQIRRRRGMAILMGVLAKQTGSDAEVVSRHVPHSEWDKMIGRLREDDDNSIRKSAYKVAADWLAENWILRDRMIEGE